MKILWKKFKVKKLKKILSTNIFFIVCNNSSGTSDKCLELAQKLSKLNLYCYSVNTKLLKNVYKESIFKNYVNSINGSIMLVLANKDCNISNFSGIITELTECKIDVLGVYFNYKMYTLNQLRKLIYLSHEKNLVLLCHTLKNLLRLPCSKFIK
jgi:ribosomal protein L10